MVRQANNNKTKLAGDSGSVLFCAQSQGSSKAHQAVHKPAAQAHRHQLRPLMPAQPQILLAVLGVSGGKGRGGGGFGGEGFGGRVLGQGFWGGLWVLGGGGRVLGWGGRVVF